MSIRDTDMEDLGFFIATAFAAVMLIVLFVFVFTAPFALIGWAILTVISLFSQELGTSAGYWGCFALGFALMVTIGLIRTVIHGD